METTFELEDVYVEDIVKGMAREMNALFFEEGNTTSFTIPEEIGKGSVMATQFASGLGFVCVKYKFKEEVIFEIEKDKIHPLKFVFNLDGVFYHKFESEEKFKKIEKYSSAIIGASPNKVHYFKIPKGKEVSLFSIELNRNLFEHKIDNFNFALDESLTSLLKDVKSRNPFFYKCFFGAGELEMIKDILNTEKKGFVGSLFKEGIAHTLLSVALEKFLGRECAENRAKMNKDDVDTILKVSDFIEENLNDLPTIEEIASKHFVSESKIQKLFKDYYKCSVHDFLSNKRLVLAKDLLEKTDKSITEIADDLGIKSKSYFSKIFKDRYGVTPSNYRGTRLSKIRFY
ncbi:AraC family transcriptional regulator [Polaribacter sp.]|nr:AraC family transcriptional regulator [Polaribacter sp.]